MIAFALVAGCGGTGGTTRLTITEPDGFGQLVPGGQLQFAWTGTYDPSALGLALRSREGTDMITLIANGVPTTGAADLTPTGYLWRDPPGGSKRPGYYDIITSPDGVEQDDAGDTHVVVLQGLVFTQPANGGSPLVVSQASPGELTFTTSTVSTLDVQILANGTLVKDVPVPSELHTVARTITWDGAPLAPGSYAITARITDTASSVTYGATGGTVTVQ